MKRSGFSLIEILVVIAIISILAGVILVNVSQSSASSRDAERRSDLRNLQSALELYKLKNGRYPSGCNGVDTWSGQKGTSYQCSSGSEYIIGLAPEFIKALPVDPRLNGNNSGYIYRTNTTGTSYKIMAKNTVETEVVGLTNEFKSCDIGPGNTPVCNRVVYNSYNVAPNCSVTDSIFQHSYAIWAGYPFEPQSGHAFNYEDQLERVICRM